MERPAYKLSKKSRAEERIYINKEALIYSGCGSKQSHFQICDSVYATSDNEVYIINNQKLIKVSFTEEEIFTQEIILELKDTWCKLYCSVAKHGYLAVCGDDQLFVLNLATQEVLSKKLNENDRIFAEMNNCVDISIHCNETRLLVADNSGVITIFRLPSMERVAELKNESAINNAKFSPNGRALCAVGDANKVYLFSIDENAPLSDDAFQKMNNLHHGHPDRNTSLGNQYTLESTVTLSTGFGDPQYCAWSADGNYILVSHEFEYSLVLSGSTLNVVNQFSFSHSLAAATSPISSLGVFCSRNKLLVFDMLDDSKLNLKQQTIFVAHFRQGSINGIGFSPSGKKFFIVTPTGLYIMDVVNIEPLKNICIKSLGTDKLRESVELGLAPQELYIEPYKPQKKDKNKDDKSSMEGDKEKEKEKLPEVFRVKLCASVAEIKETYGEYHDLDESEGSDIDMSYDEDFDGEDDDESYEEDMDDDDEEEMNVD